MPSPFSLRELAARMIMPSLTVSRYHADEQYRNEIRNLILDECIGGFIIFDGTIAATRTVIDDVQSIARERLLIACDLEPGLNTRLTNAVPFPHAMAIGRTDETTCVDVGAYIGAEARAAGIDVNFAPVCDINSNSRNPIINTRSFGESADHVSRFASAFIAGLHRVGIQSVIKHFPGHGDTSQDSHLLLPVIDSSLLSLEEIELSPFRNAIDNGADGVMVAHILARVLDEHRPASLSEAWIEHYLRITMGFRGLVFTDAMNMKAICDRYPAEKSAELAVRAGCDVLVMPVETRKAIDGIVIAATNDPVLETRMEESNSRLKHMHACIENSKGMTVQINQHYGNKLSKNVARRGLKLSGDRTLLVPKGKCAIVLLGGPSDIETTLYAYNRLREKNIRNRWNIIHYIKSSNYNINQYDRIVFMMFSGIVSFQGFLGDTIGFQHVINNLSQTVKEIIGISIGNPYIWADLTEFSCSIDTFSNSQSSIDAIVDLLIDESK